ncbi:UDP-N-acetylmuramoylalanine--D-glutamate ligase [Erysipelotrichaceae bacterium MTC7]|nr:UDP-N-acetylmuramoylalanine--D-glutamate ligase [Erysipelotrichaceae bacterium MTC7]
MKKVLVIGAARSGIAVSKLLCKENYEVIITDQNTIAKKAELEKMGIKVFDGGHPESLKDETYDFIVKNPGIPYHVPFVAYFVEKKVPIYTEIEVGYRLAPAFTYGAITGTNGKTTTVSMLYEILKAHGSSYVAGNIGIPLSEVVLQHGNEKANIALELSNFQLLGIDTFKAKVSCVTNLTPDHLDYMDGVDAYYESKMRIFKNADPDAFFLRNLDDENVIKYAKDIPCRVLDYSLHQKADIYIQDDIVYYHDIQLFDTKKLQVVGAHNISNAMVASTMAYLMGVQPATIQNVLTSFTGVEHRLEYVASKHDIRFFNDSKATNPEAVVPALEAFPKNIILLAGGYDKKLPFDILKTYDERVKMCFSFGQTKDAFKDIFTHNIACQTMEEALRDAYTLAKPGDVILLSPACASYDQFKSYEERGELFKVYVHEMLGEEE